MKRFLLLAVLVVAVLNLCGCESVRNTFRWVGRADSVVDPRIDYENLPGEGAQKRLALLFAPVDERIELLVESVSTREARPDREWFGRLALESPWVSGAAVVDKRGQVVEQVPETSIKPLFAQEFLGLSQDWKQTPLKAVVKRTDFGPEVYLVQPVLDRGEWQGLLIVHFDPRNLMRYCPDPDRLMVLSGEVPLWPTLPKNSGEPLLAQDWTAMTTRRVNGVVEAGGNRFTWLARHLGGTHIVYVVRNLDGE